MSPLSDRHIYVRGREHGYVGGGYYDPVEEFIRVARPLSSPELLEAMDDTDINLANSDLPTYVVETLYHAVKSLLGDDECAFGLYSLPNYQVAVFLTDEYRLMDFESQVAAGSARREGFFALTTEFADIGMTRPNDG